MAAADHPVLNVIAEILGWVYCLIWSVVWVPQVIHNFRTKTASGLSSQFLLLNIIGYLFYFLFVWFGSYYQAAHDLPRSIVIQDKFFATAAMTFITTLAVQTFILWPHTRSDKFGVPVLIIVGVLLLIGSYNCLLSLGGALPWFSDKAGYAYSTLHFFGYGKSFCSLVKQVPQVLLNYSRKHTVGHNMMGPVFDLIGGSSSLIQMVLRCFINAKPDGSPDWSLITSNIPKVFLSLESIFFDSIFLTQTYILYRSNNAKILAEMAEKQEEINIGTDVDERDHDGVDIDTTKNMRINTGVANSNTDNFNDLTSQLSPIAAEDKPLLPTDVHNYRSSDQ